MLFGGNPHCCCLQVRIQFPQECINRRLSSRAPCCFSKPMNPGTTIYSAFIQRIPFLQVLPSSSKCPPIRPIANNLSHLVAPLKPSHHYPVASKIRSASAHVLQQEVLYHVRVFPSPLAPSACRPRIPSNCSQPITTALLPRPISCLPPPALTTPATTTSSYAESNSHRRHHLNPSAETTSSSTSNSCGC